MKTKMKQKKLVLKKIAIALLDKQDMNQAKGGTSSSIQHSCFPPQACS